MPWWGWLGGLIGAAYVTTVPLLIPEIGTAATIGLTVAGQQLASLAVDRHGLLRLPRRPLTPTRKAGVALILSGVALLEGAHLHPARLERDSQHLRPGAHLVSNPALDHTGRSRLAPHEHARAGA